MKVAVMIPWRPGDVWREAAFGYVARWWLERDFPLATAGASQAGPFNRAAARNAAARLVDLAMGEWEVGIFADADCFLEGREQVDAGVTLAAETGRLVNPFELVTPLARDESRALLAGRLKRLPRRHPEPDPSVGGCIIVPRPLFERLGGFDEGFVGWGFEDYAFYTAAGGGLRVGGELWHMWHPPAPETNPRHPLHQANRDHAASLGYTP